MSHEVSEAEIFRYIETINYPATRDRLVNIATQHSATDDVIEVLQNLPDKEYTTPNDISYEIEKFCRTG